MKRTALTLCIGLSLSESALADLKSNVSYMCSNDGPIRESKGRNCSRPAIGAWAERFCGNAKLNTRVKFYLTSNCHKEAEPHKDDFPTGVFSGQEKSLKEILEKAQGEVVTRADAPDNQKALCKKGGPIRKGFDTPHAGALIGGIALIPLVTPLVLMNPSAGVDLLSPLFKMKAKKKYTVGQVFWAEQFCKGIDNYEKSQFHDLALHTIAVLKNDFQRQNLNFDDYRQKYITAYEGGIQANLKEIDNIGSQVDGKARGETTSGKRTGDVQKGTYKLNR